jgi:curved DNA-binding protein
MGSDKPFVDYYTVLRVHPECDGRTLEIAFRRMAQLYHPDHSETADIEQFQLATEAYRALKDPAKRLAYDATYTSRTGYVFSSADQILAEERTALSDADVHAQTLMYLYKRRRERALEPGVGAYELQNMLGCSDEAYDFHVWYLKAKGLVEITDQGSLAITIAGVDHVISASRAAAQEKLRITQFGASPVGRAWPRDAAAA